MKLVIIRIIQIICFILLLLDCFCLKEEANLSLRRKNKKSKSKEGGANRAPGTLKKFDTLVDASGTNIDKDIPNFAKIAHVYSYDTQPGETVDDISNMQVFYEDPVTNEEYLTALGPDPAEKVYKVLFGVLNAFGGKQAAVISFRGSANLDNFITDADVADVYPTSKNKKPCASCKVHKGFQEAYKSVRDKLRTKFLEFYNSKGMEFNRIFITGHSLGGAMATLCAYDFGNFYGALGIKISLITFGSPRVGDLAFETYINKELGLEKNVRVRWNKDPVTYCPETNKLTGGGDIKYDHVGTLITFTKPNVNKKEEKNTDIDFNKGICTPQSLLNIFPALWNKNKVSALDGKDHVQYKLIDKSTLWYLIVGS